jgi:ribosomal protein S18 acetylase RimI-like enzyme
VAPGALAVRAVEPADGAALRRLFERNRHTTAAETFDPFELTAERALLIAGQRSADRYYLAWLADELVGMSMLRGYDEGYAIPSLGILVDAVCHGRGIGRELSAWTLAAARAGGAPGVRLSVYGDNPAALELYRSLGFTERERSLVERPSGTREKIVMELEWEGLQ